MPGATPCGPVAEDGILEVTLDRPKANAIDLATSREMGEVFAAFRDDPDLRVAIVRTEGDKFFCAGWDLKAAADGDAGRRRLRRRRLRRAPGAARPQQAGHRRRARPGDGRRLRAGPVVRPDLRLGGRPSSACPEINAGTLADAATIKLPKRMPYHVAMELLLTGRWMAAAEARALGRGQRGAARRGGRPWPAPGRPPGCSPSGPPLVFAAIKETARAAESLRFQEALDLVTTSTLPTVGDALRLRGRPRGLQGLRREAQAGLEGPLTARQ